MTEGSNDFFYKKNLLDLIQALRDENIVELYSALIIAFVLFPDQTAIMLVVCLGSVEEFKNKIFL